MNNTENQQDRHGSRETRIHGTYPYDNEKERWRQVRSLTPEEAAELTGICMADATRNKHNDGVYLWLNKGYIVLGTQVPAISALSAGLLEAFGGSCTRAWRVGTQAVYLHDGYYFLIERY